MKRIGARPVWIQGVGWNLDTAYWTSQNLTFGNFALWTGGLGVTSFVSALDLDPAADIDLGVHEALLADYVEKAFERLREPFFVTIQLSNTHYPYFVDPEGQRIGCTVRLDGEVVVDSDGRRLLQVETSGSPRFLCRMTNELPPW